MSTVMPMGHQTRFRDARDRHPAGRRRAGRRPEIPRTDRRRAAELGPDPVRLIDVIARAYLEIEAGRRPLAHLEPLLAPGLAVRLAAALPRRGAPGPTIDAVGSVRCSKLSDRAVDGVVIVRRGERVGALAIRVERHHGAWRVVELALPEDGAAAPSFDQVS